MGADVSRSVEGESTFGCCQNRKGTCACACARGGSVWPALPPPRRPTHPRPCLPQQPRPLVRRLEGFELRTEYDAQVTRVPRTRRRRTESSGAWRWVPLQRVHAALGATCGCAAVVVHLRCLIAFEHACVRALRACVRCVRAGGDELGRLHFRFAACSGVCAGHQGACVCRHALHDLPCLM